MAEKVAKATKATKTVAKKKAVVETPKTDETVSSMDPQKTFFLLQVNDPTFPIGAYSHSFGLETYIDKRIVVDEETTRHYIETNLRGSFLYTELLAASLAYDYALANDTEKLTQLDKTIRAIKSPSEIRSAGEKLGSRYLKAINSMGVENKGNIIEAYVTKCSELNIEPNYSVAYGVSCAAQHIDKAESLKAYLYGNASGLVTNAVKSVPLSQSSGQGILAKLYPLFETMVQEAMVLEEDKLGLSMPGFEVRSMQHEVLYTRLYMS